MDEPTSRPPAPSSDRAYWRSLERLADSPALAGLADELPADASSPPEEWTRRGALGLLGASLALAGLAGCRRPVETIVPLVEPPERRLPGIPERYATTLALGTHAYGVVVESHEGRPTKIEGNELHPASLGASSAWMQASILDLYDPDRSRRVSRRGDDGRRPSDWGAFADWWSGRAQAAAGRDGRGLAFLVEPYTSPTTAHLARRLRERFPQALWAAWGPAGEGGVHAGLSRATGRDVRAVYRLERARRIVALDADLFGVEPGAVTHARAFAAGRRAADSMNRLYALEPLPSITGAAADHRLAVPAGAIPAVAVALLAELAERGLGDLPDPPPAPPLPAELRRRLATVADDLASHRGEALVVAGSGQPPAVHVIVEAIRRALSAHGRTVDLVPLADAEAGRSEDLASLVDALDAGEVDTLVVLGGNPAYEAPAELDLAKKIAAVPHSLHLADRLDETSRLVDWHLPRSHFLEAWGDARAADGTASVVQPLIAPLFDSRSRDEVLAFLAGDGERSGHSLVNRVWLDGVIGNRGFESRWRRTLHDGVLAGSAATPVDAALAPGAVEAAISEIAAAPPQEGATELVLRPSPAVLDGRFANNAWLQELPDPITKLTWDNALLVAPRQAGELGIESGDVVRVQTGERELQVPAFVLPGVATGSAGLSLGYGRRSAGRVGDGVGVDAAPLRSLASPWRLPGVRLAATGAHRELATTQEHWEMEGRDLIREATAEEARSAAGHGPGGEHAGHGADELLFPQREYAEEPQWGMAIDLSACTGCNACVIACQAENNVPVVGREQVARGREMHWLRIDRYFSGRPEEPGLAFQPVPCMHCENAPCEQVCPVGATVHDAEGLNAMVYNRCIGTRYCSNNCPYKVRRFNFFHYTHDLPELVRMAQNPDVTVRSRGVMEKCTYCTQRIQEAKAAAARAGRGLADGDVTTACQQSCPTRAIVFGDLSDPQSRVSRAKADPRDYVLLGHLGHRPRTSYAERLRNPHPEWT